MTRGTKITVFLLGAFAMALLTFIGGFFTSQYMVVLSNQRLNATSRLTKDVSDLYHLMQKNALDPPDETTATIGALNGLAKSNGDKYARYLPADMLQKYSEGMSGEFGGIGVLLGEKDDTVYVLKVYADTPAEKAGIQVGDYFYSVDGESSDSWTTEEISSKVRGEVGTKVEITLLRPYEEDKMPDDATYVLGSPYTVTVTRGKIESPNTELKMLDGKVGYVRLFEFNLKATDELQREFEDLISQGATSLILDLRENPGGDLQQAIGVSSLFIKSGTIVKIESRMEGKSEELAATGKTLSKELPLVCLIDGNSASASEIVSGALQDNHRAVLLGTRSFGKGSVQTLFPLRNGGAMRLTTARYYTPDGRSIQGQGIEPDVIVHEGDKPLPDFGPAHEWDLNNTISNSGGTKAEAPRRPDLQSADGIPEKPPKDWPKFDPAKPNTDFQLHEALILVRHLAADSGLNQPVQRVSR